MKESDEGVELRSLSSKTHTPLIRVRFASNCPDIVTELDARTTTTSLLKTLIQDSRPVETRGRLLRIIYLGKILQDDALLVDVLKAGQDEIVVQCSIGGLLTDLHGPSQTHAGTVDGNGNSNGNGDGNGNGRRSSSSPDLGLTTPAPRGFDRLRTAGLTDAEISDLRAEFNAARSGGGGVGGGGQGQSRDDEEYMPTAPDQLDAALNAEEAWIDNDAMQPGSGDGSSGSDPMGVMYWDVLVGCCIGYFFGFGALFWVFGLGYKNGIGAARTEAGESAGPGEVMAQRYTRIFSEKKTVAIFAGLLFNLLYGLCRT